MKMMMKTLLGVGIAIGLVVVAGAAVVQSGAYNVAADVPHTDPVYSLLETARERSIAVRAGKLQVPADLDDPERIRQGAGNYAAMCLACHLAPDMGETELSKGLYPAPPNLTSKEVDAAEAFWVIKHGIKASGMPAWGTSMGDEYIWNMAAFLQKLPGMDRPTFDALVASSDGHSHGGGETDGHSHGDGSGDDHHDDSEGGMEDHHGGAMQPHAETGGAASRSSSAPTSGETHAHADGMPHEHASEAPPASKPVPAPADKTPPPEETRANTPPAEHADDGHDHQH